MIQKNMRMRKKNKISLIVNEILIVKFGSMKEMEYNVVVVFSLSFEAQQDQLDIIECDVIKDGGIKPNLIKNIERHQALGTTKNG